MLNFDTAAFAMDHVSPLSLVVADSQEIILSTKLIRRLGKFCRKLAKTG
jgi:hypothetical protein